MHNDNLKLMLASLRGHVQKQQKTFKKFSDSLTLAGACTILKMFYSNLTIDK